MLRGVRAVGGLALALMGCVTQAPSPDPPSSRVHHIVLCWLTSPGDAGAVDRLVATTRSLGDLPGVLEVRVGPPLPSDRVVVDDSFDVGIVMTFTGPEALAAYLVHPDHLRAVEDVLRPLVARMVVYDVVD